LYLVVKRLFDLFFALVGLVFALPLLVIFGVGIKLESKGPFLYCQERLGKDGKPFTLYKLRSMKVDAEWDGPQWAEKDDPRVLKLGRFIRQTRIDELPQLFNVLKGEMSIVGPRPERSFFCEQFSRTIPGFSQRLQVKPGLTGWAQINGGYNLTPGEKLAKDLEYIRNRSLWLDLKIVVRTVKVVLDREGAR
jgi:exopolysaccharide biosynthesis polyprenyl glycosylphosphotransferase